LLCDPASLDRPQRTAEGFVLGFATFGEPANSTKYSRAGRHASRRAGDSTPFVWLVPVRLDALRHNLAIEEEWQLEREHARLAGAIVAA